MGSGEGFCRGRGRRCRSCTGTMGERISAGKTPTAFGGNNSGTGVGGSMLHWGAFVPRADARDLKLKTDSGQRRWISRWTYEELVPFYEEVGAVPMGVSGPKSLIRGIQERRYPLPPIALNAPADCDAEGLRRDWRSRRRRLQLRRFRQRYTQPGYAERQPCVGCGFCHQGCAFNGAKASMDVTWHPPRAGCGCGDSAEELCAFVSRRDASGADYGCRVPAGMAWM